MARKSSVDKLKERLYSKTEAPKVDPASRTPFSPARDEAPHSWSDVHQSEPVAQGGAGMPPFNPKPPMTRKKRSAPLYFLLGSIAFFVVAAIIALYTFYSGGNTISPQNIDVEIVATPSLIDSGKQATIEYLISNKNNAPLQAADLIIDYPQGARDAQRPTEELTHDRITIGDIPAGGQVKKTAQVLFYGPEGSQETINATLEYQLQGSNGVFTRAGSALLTIGSSPVTLSVNAPEQAISGQPFSLDVTVTSNSSAPIQNVAVQAQYPFGFAVNQSSPKADVGNTLWRLGTLGPGDSKTVHLTGALTGEDGDERVFHFLVGSESDLTESTLALPMLSVPESLTVRKPFLSGEISLDGQTGSVIPEQLGKTIEGTIHWQNNASTTLNNVVLSLSLSGQALNPSSIQADAGFYDSTKGQILWSSQQDPALASVPPSASGSFSFRFSTYPPSQLNLVNPKLALNLSVSASGSGNGGPSNVSSAASATVNLASSATLQSLAEYSSGPFKNTGPVPPKVGQPTTYTIVWTVKNSSNTIAGSKVQAVLPLYVSWAGAQSGSGEQVSYDSTSRTVVWNLGDVKAGTGYGSSPRQAAFQVTLTPSLSQVGQAPALTSDVTFSGQDRFAQAMVEAGAAAPTTQLTENGGNFSSGLVTQ